MADEQTTDVTNSEAATPTDAAATTDTTTSNTETTTTEGQPGDTADTGTTDGGDPLDADAGLAAADGATDGTTDGEDGGADDTDAGDPTDPNELIGAPEGDYELELPEGMSLNAEALAEFAPFAKELNLSNKGLVALAEKGLPLVEKQFTTGMVESVVAQRKAWDADGRAYVGGGKLSDGTEIEASKVFAGENHAAVMAVSAKAIDRFTTDETGQPLLFPNAKLNAETGEMEPGTFRDFLKTTGLGNHPAMLFLCYRAGHAISEDSDFELHGGTPQTKLTREDRYYGNSRKQT